MKSAAMRLLGNRKSSYLSCLTGCFFAVISLFIVFFTDLDLEMVGSLFIISTLLYTFSWISYVSNDRRISNTLLRESRALRDLTTQQTKISRSLEDLETGLRTSLDEYQKACLDEIKIQAFNSHLAVQDLKTYMPVERDHHG